jgi:hypothetical protein
VAEFGGEGDAVVGVGPGFEVGREERAIPLGVAVVVVVGEVAVVYADDGRSLGPMIGDGWADVAPGAFDGGTRGDLQMFFERGLALVFEYEVIVASGSDKGGVDDTVAGVEEDFGGCEVFEVRRGGVEDAMVEAGITGVVAGKATGDGGGPKDQPAFVVGLVVEGGSPGVECGGFIGEDVELLVGRPVEEVGGGGMANDGGAAPGPGPDEMEGAVGTALEEGVAHEFVGRGLVEDGAVLVGDGPVVAVGADGVVDTVFAIAFEPGEEPGGVRGKICWWPWCGLLCRSWKGQREQEGKDGELRHGVIIAVILEHEKCASLVTCAFFNLGGLLLRGGRLGGGGGLGAGEDGAVGGGVGERDGEADGGKHEDHGRPGSHLGEEVGCAARAKGRLRTLTAEGSGEVG